MPHDLILSFKHQWKLKELALFPQVKELLMDKEAAQYFVKLHIIAGQMNTERMNNTDTFYTLTGKSGEIFNGDKVRVSLILLPEQKSLLSQCPQPTLSVVGLLKFMKNFFPYSLFAKALPYEGRSRAQHQEGSGRRDLLWKEVIKCWILLWSEFVFKRTSFGYQQEGEALQ